LFAFQCFKNRTQGHEINAAEDYNGRDLQVTKQRVLEPPVPKEDTGVKGSPTTHKETSA